MKCKLILAAQEASTLEEMAAHHPYADFRPRALGLLALSEGTSVRDIAHFLRVSKQTIYQWSYGWRRAGLVAILGGHVGGRHLILSEAMIDTAVTAACAEPLRLADIVQRVHEVHPDAPDFSRDALTRALKSRRLSCQRTRMSLKKSVPPASHTPA